MIEVVMAEYFHVAELFGLIVAFSMGTSPNMEINANAV
jgi:hypothetical protein